MRKPLSILALGLVLLLGLAAGAAAQTTFTTTLRGAEEVPGPGDPDASGFATVTIQGTTITYSILVNGITTPTAAHIHRGAFGVPGPVVVPLNPTFGAGCTSGTVTNVDANLIAQILANPAAFYVNVHSTEFPDGAVRGQLGNSSPLLGGRTFFIPVVGKLTGARNEDFITDVRIINRSTVPATVTIDFFASSATALSGPTATRTIVVGPQTQHVLNDVLGTLFSTDGSGALRITSDQDIQVVSRILNDKRQGNGGTTGLFVPASTLDETCSRGLLPFLSSASPSDTANGAGFRTNIGWFNPNAFPVTVTFTARRNDGTILGTETVTIPAFSRLQLGVWELFNDVPENERRLDDYYVTYQATGGTAVIYAAVVDNKTGDGYYTTGFCTTF
jgi:CHRD domain-containing protein